MSSSIKTSICFAARCLFFGTSSTLSSRTFFGPPLRINHIKVMCYNIEAEARFVYKEATIHADPFMFGLLEIREGVLRMLSGGREAVNIKVYYLLEVMTEFGREVCESAIKPVASFVHQINSDSDSGDSDDQPPAEPQQPPANDADEIWEEECAHPGCSWGIHCYHVEEFDEHPLCIDGYDSDGEWFCPEHRQVEQCFSCVQTDTFYECS